MGSWCSKPLKTESLREYEPELLENDCRGSRSLITDILGEPGGDDREMDFWEAVSPSSVSSLDTFLAWYGRDELNVELNVGGDGGGRADDEEVAMEYVLVASVDLDAPCLVAAGRNGINPSRICGTKKVIRRRDPASLFGEL